MTSSYSYVASPKIQIRNTQGQFMSGGKLYVQNSGASTALKSYRCPEDADKEQNPHTYPIILDPFGQTSVCTNANAKLVLTDENDVSYWTQDGIRSSGTRTYSTITQINGNLPNETVTGVAAITLDPGDYNVDGFLHLETNLSRLTILASGIHTSYTALPTFYSQLSDPGTASIPNFGMELPTVRVNSSTSTTLYINIYIKFSIIVGTALATGTFHVRKFP